jgi:anti-sigma factor RsiW
MRCDEAQELITGLVDNELTATDRAAVEGHLAQCPGCRAQFERETALKRDVRLAASAIVVPRALREKIQRREDKFGSDTLVSKKVSVLNRLAAPRGRPIYALAAAVLVIVALLFQLQPNEDIATSASAIHESVVSGKRALVRVNDAAQLRNKLTIAVNDRFSPIVLDLSMIKLRPVSGFVEKIAQRDVLITVYEGAGATITCFTLLGDEGDAPEDSSPIFDADKKMNFYAFSRGKLNGVMHREDEVICVLVSNMTPAELLDVARGKPHHA